MSNNRRVKAERCFDEFKQAPCPECGKYNQRIGYGDVVCVKCGLRFSLVDRVTG